MEESMLYAMNYMPDSIERSHKQGHGKWMDENGECAYPIEKNGKVYNLTSVQYQQAHIWVLKHYTENEEWERKYDEYIQSLRPIVQNQRGAVQTEKVIEYIQWLRQELRNGANNVMKRLADGHSFEAISYNAYAINGYVFHTLDAEMNKTTQNSGVSMKALTRFRSSVGDANLVHEEAAYYGVIKQILELDYHDFKQVIFYCDWVHIEDKHGCYVDPATNLIYVNLRRLQRNSEEDDGPFILASQGTQVFYCKDHSRPADDWHVVLDVPKKLNQDVDSCRDPLVFEARTNGTSLSATLQDAIVDDEEI